MEINKIYMELKKNVMERNKKHGKLKKHGVEEH